MIPKNQIITSLKVDFPDMPNEVFVEWLIPYAKDLGWPPAGNSIPRWNKILLNKPKTFWASLSWQHELNGLDFHDLDIASQQRLMLMRQAYFDGDPNGFHTIDDGLKRVTDAASYIEKSGVTPSCVTILRGSTGYYIADGHHRLLAYFLMTGGIPPCSNKRKNSPHFKLNKWIGIPQISMGH